MNITLEAPPSSATLHTWAAPPAPAARGPSIALAGSGGGGVMTAGNLLLDAAARAGAYALMVRTSGPQIRGGEAAALLRLDTQPVLGLADEFDLLLALDWQNMHRFGDEIALGPHSVIVGDTDAGDVPAVFLERGARVMPLAFKALAKSIPGSWVNMLALGVSGVLAGLPRGALEDALRASWRRSTGLEANLQALAAGMEAGAAIADALVASGHPFTALAPITRDATAPRWALSGNEAAGYGAIRGGIRFVAAYPITPATELLEWMAPALSRVGGSLLQAEDELASINMIIGASFGGVPSLTATAGPGLALMAEGIGLAVAAEIPIVVVDVMRGGPSTGIPAKSEQSDLSFAVNGLHGDAPRLVLAPSSIADCALTTQWAVHLAETLQAPALVLSDQFIGQSRAIIEAPVPVDFGTQRLRASAGDAPYRRYLDTPSGVSPMAYPGTPGTIYTADGLTHTQAGVPSSQSADHRLQMDKRLRKLQAFDYGDLWADLSGQGSAAVITFGSVTPAVREAVERAGAQGLALRLIVLRLLAPLCCPALASALEGVTDVMVVEQNHSGQLRRYLRGEFDFARPPVGFNRPGPLPLRPQEILQALLAWRSAS